ALAFAQCSAAGFPPAEPDPAVDFRRVGARAPHARLVHQYLDTPADLRTQAARADLGLQLHQAPAALSLHSLGHRVGERVRRSAVDRGIREASDAVELGFLEEREQLR